MPVCQIRCLASHPGRGEKLQLKDNAGGPVEQGGIGKSARQIAGRLHNMRLSVPQSNPLYATRPTTTLLVVAFCSCDPASVSRSTDIVCGVANRET